MTRKDFEATAKILNAQKERTERDRNQVGANMVDSIALDFADQFASENPRFDRAKFLQASGYYRSL